MGGQCGWRADKVTLMPADVRVRVSSCDGYYSRPHISPKGNRAEMAQAGKECIRGLPHLLHFL